MFEFIFCKYRLNKILEPFKSINDDNLSSNEEPKEKNISFEIETVNEKKLDQLEEKINQLKNQKKAILQREKEKERKARTKRLIQIGELCEKHFKSENYSIEVIEEFLKNISSDEVWRSWKEEKSKIVQNER